MTFAELCAAVAEEVNGRPLAFSSISLTTETDPFKRRVIGAVKKAYLDVLQQSNHWKFLNVRGKIVDLTNGVSSYYLPLVRSIEWDSLYLTKAGTTARWPVTQLLYNDWQQMERIVSSISGPPLYWANGASPDYWIAWPTPTETWALNGNSQLKPTPFAAAGDSPQWDAEYHEMLVWFAVHALEGRVKTQDEAVSGLNARSASVLPLATWNNFCAQYLPSFEGIAPLV